MARTIIGTHSPPIPFLGGNRPCQLLAVLVEDSGTNTQVAYQAIVPSAANGEHVKDNANAVANHGAKLRYEEAQRHWPSIERGKYQR